MINKQTLPPIKGRKKKALRSCTKAAEIAAAVKAIDELTPPDAKTAEFFELLKEWLQDESGYDEETWPQLKKALDAERTRVGARRLFDG